jgi:hypothetical protein
MQTGMGALQVCSSATVDSVHHYVGVPQPLSAGRHPLHRAATNRQTINFQNVLWLIGAVAVSHRAKRWAVGPAAPPFQLQGHMLQQSAATPLGMAAAAGVRTRPPQSLSVRLGPQPLTTVTQCHSLCMTLYLPNCQPNCGCDKNCNKLYDIVATITAAGVINSFGHDYMSESCDSYGCTPAAGCRPLMLAARPVKFSAVSDTTRCIGTRVRLCRQRPLVIRSKCTACNPALSIYGKVAG